VAAGASPAARESCTPGCAKSGRTFTTNCASRLLETESLLPLLHLLLLVVE
jgi:hypothetical protein